MTVLVKHWQPTSLAAIFDAIQAEAFCNRAIREATVPDMIEMAAFRGGLPIIACLSAKPHIDDQSPRYVALWIMRSIGHRIGVSKTRPADLYRDTHPRPRNRVEYEAVQGEIALLDTQALHWLLPGDGVFAAVGFETDIMPTIEEVEARFAMLGEAP